MTYIKEILPKTCCSEFILQDNGTEFKNEQLISVFDTLGIKHIYSNPYFPQGNGRIDNLHNFLKCTIAKFTYSSQIKWDDALPLATYSYNITPSVDDLEPPYYLIHGQDPIKGRLSNLHNYCRYMCDQPGRLAIQELQKLWKIHGTFLAENRIAKSETNKKVTKASNLKIDQWVPVKNHHKGPFDPTYIYNHWVAGIPNNSTVLLTTPGGKERKCNIHHVKPVSSLNVCVGSQMETPTAHSINSGTAYS